MAEALSLLQRKFLDSAIGIFNPKPPVSVGLEATLAVALDKLKEHKIGCLLINTEDGITSGVFTERDALTRAAFSKVDPETAPITDFMTSDPVLMRPQTSVAKLLFMMAHRHFRHVIIGVSGSASGVVSIKDVVDYVYVTLTRMLVERPTGSEESSVASESALHRFFVQKIEALRPAAPITVRPDFKIRKTLEIICDKRIGSVMVTDDTGALCGIFTERDYLLKVARSEHNIETTSISEVMTPNPETLQGYATVALAFNTLSEGGFRHLPIVDESEALVGVLSVRNFIEILAQSIVEDLEDSRSVARSNSDGEESQ